ncbi:hypothetical protein I9W82_005451 [Candida metapsilosis]|uniref:Uncharacterized protein n=1 Tax=Candida metapsilosis TaxID=273372 RepID=A0A8H8DAE9_9ASCO|nr:hypothetical protein I9W82_005451 [Candida metapsilosis]
MITRGNKAPASNTDYSSEPEQFFSSLLGNSHQPQDTQPTQTKLRKESTTLLQHAARLELESITLKESISKANISLQRFPKKDLQEMSTSIVAVKRDLAEIRSEINTNQTLLQKGLEKVAINNEISNLLERSTANQEKVCGSVDGKISALESSAKDIHVQISAIQERQINQNETLGQVLEQFSSLDNDIKDIKQFLSLLVPRLMMIEKMIVPYLTQTNATSRPRSESEVKPKRRKLE